MADRPFTAVRRTRRSIIVTGVAHDNGSVTIDAYYDHVTARSMGEAVRIIGTLSTEPIDIVWH